ncbi:hypothetical protein J2X45_003405 [Caulobacter sp. BE264]|uniref:hypothetical protein n=1 Tax=Caulobacter sp. BE264 TaxID=2817724 RepID=UPI002865F267|nr:hypothetical protein [Caulobacter sp. BE264]MDR7232299.1 hypothetical protein [Caulobacter sp. BE264]
MKLLSSEAQAAIEAGTAVSSGAVLIGTTPTPVQVWGGYGELTFGSPAYTFQGVGDHGLIRASGGQLGGAAQGVTLELSGVEPALLALLDQAAIAQAPVIIWRLLFDATGRTLLDYPVFTRGRLDKVVETSTVGGASTLTASVEGAAKALGRNRARTRSDADQRLEEPDDAGFSATAYAGSKVLYLGGKIPANASSGGAYVGGGVGGGKFVFTDMMSF